MPDKCRTFDGMAASGRKHWFKKIVLSDDVTAKSGET
jgi:hypothetical protein